MAFPNKGISRAELLRHLESIREVDVKWKDGRTWSLVYYLNEQHHDLVNDVFSSFLSENYLNPFAFESLRQLERDVVAMTRELLHGDESAVGTFSSGGTESIFLALYAYRERARRIRGEGRKYEVIVPASIHPAFDKAAHILGLVLKRIPVDGSYRADPAGMARAINTNTILIAASAPCYPHGILDPVEQIATVASDNNLPMHVDACIGGFMLPWVEQIGYPVAPWDFRVKGVTSISADLHKFGYAAKGASVLLYRNSGFLRDQIFVQPDWSGGVYASATFQGSRSGGPIAAAWASMRSLGREGYMEIAEELMTGTQRFIAGLAGMPDIEVIGKPVMNIIAFRSLNKSVDIFVVAEKLEQKGWVVDRQQAPASIHATIMPSNVGRIDEYLEDIREAIGFARNNPKASSQGQAALYGLMSRMPLRGVVEKNVRKMMLDLYSGEGDPDGRSDVDNLQEVPRWMGIANKVLKWLGVRR